MNNYGFAELVRQLQVTDENRCLDVEGCTTQAVESGFADGEYLGVGGALLKEEEIVVAGGICNVPGMETDRVPLARLGLEAARIHRDERCRGVKPMGVNVEDVYHGTGS